MGRKAVLVAVVACTLVMVAGLALAGCGSSNKPKINSLSPTSGEASSQVVVNGEKFGSAQGTGTVHFGDTLADEVAWGDTTISVKVPSHLAAGVFPVTVTTKDGSSNEVDFTVTDKAAPPAPAKVVKITSLTPSSGVAGIQVVAAGTNFGSAKGKILFGAGTAEVVSWSDTSVTFKVPAGSTPNTYGVKVDTADGVKSNEAIYTLHAPPKPDMTAQLNAVAAFLGMTPDQVKGWQISLKKRSAIDPNWEVVTVVKSDGGTFEAMLVWNNMLGDWECLSIAGPPWTGVEFKGMAVPSDLVSE
jgi:hypothetical protein